MKEFFGIYFTSWLWYELFSTPNRYGQNLPEGFYFLLIPLNKRLHCSSEWTAWGYHLICRMLRMPSILWAYTKPFYGKFHSTFTSSISKITIHLSPSSNLTRCVSLNYFCPSKWRDSSQLGSIDGKCFQQSTALFYGPNLSIFSLSLLYYFKQQEEKKKFKSDELNDKIMECKFFKFFSHSV